MPLKRYVLIINPEDSLSIVEAKSMRHAYENHYGKITSDPSGDYP
ncbi:MULTISPECIES: hypothetical protein [Halobacillus]|uniref:Uncharacterized protein n=1 Tax=Halobacillus halophilus (strain ATCC 35676 / DSM 2266 / JCM 20832 / KCTC 3685 / LMG 17431 / NBRC 102448 / NCIMB 2269) TaxID=866895 RepID=I0JJF5_HALH3|nr:hypothetical protein [Halobacillus halophilus]CCG44273.1 hypothetical protein HBHAL_1911 [Halobacillus halophilus DSM 2266]